MYDPKDTRVIRECGEETNSKEKEDLGMCWKHSDTGYFQEMCTCRTDLCNSAYAREGAGVLIASAIATLFLLFQSC